MSKVLQGAKAVISTVLTTPKARAVSYLVALVLAETLTTLIAPQAGMIFHGLILLALLLHASLGNQHLERRFLLVLALVPLIRLLSLTLPLSNFPMMYWYVVIGVPLFITAFMVARLAGYKGKMIGLHLKWRAVPLQLLIGIFGIVLGYIEYQILRPEPLVAELRWELIWLPALIFLIFTGLLEEIIFRGLLQTSATEELGRLGILYVSILFAVLHIGYRSLIDVIFVFAVAVLFGVLTQRKGSLAGVSLSHGLTNISLYLVFPFLLAAPAAMTSSPAVMLSPVDISLSEINTLTLEPDKPDQIPISLPKTTPIPTPTKKSTELPAQEPTIFTPSPSPTPVPPSETPRVKPTFAPAQGLSTIPTEQGFL